MPTRNDRPWHALGAAETLRDLGSAAEGLNDAEAASRLASYGPNALPAEARPSRFLLFLSQFNSLLTFVLIAAAGLSLFLGHIFDAIAILSETVINAVVGYAQERKAEAALAKLKGMIVPTASVRRGGRMTRVPAADLVPGDVVLVAQGDRVGADLRLFDVRDLRVDESALTGESVPSGKDEAPSAPGAALGDRHSMAFMGTLVAAGEGAGVVVATGTATVFGGIAGSLARIERAPTPLETRVDRLGRALGLGALGLAAAIFLIGIVRGLPALDMFLFAVAAAVSAIPEGLPVVLAITLAIGVQRMARRGAITRHLPTVETLGSADVICTDKTGTLTQNEMTVRRMTTLTHAVDVTGEGWKPEGEFLLGGEKLRLTEHPSVTHLLRVAALCNRASIERRGSEWTATGDPTEAALTVVASKGGFDRAELFRDERTLDEIPFTSERRMRAILHEYQAPDDGTIREVMMVGAFEVVMKASSRIFDAARETDLDPEQAARLKRQLDGMTGSAMRVLAAAVKRVPVGKDELGHDDLQGLTFLGLFGMTDPPRPGVAEAVRRCQAAGIRVIMNTGDHRDTAVAVAREVGILGAREPVTGRVFDDRDVTAMSDAQLGEALRTAAVFARVSPETKLRVVTQLRALGHVVAMTGDGINDAPALKRADIGVAMGIAGTDVTKEVADMVLSDDDFVSIVSAVEEGRIIFRNVRQTTSYLFMTNCGEVVTILAALALGWPLPLLPAQLLWLNVVTDGFTDVALATEKRQGDELTRPPRPKDAPILPKSLLILTIPSALLMAIGTLGLFFWADHTLDLGYARSLAFLSMSFFQLWNVFGMRSESRSVFSIGWTTNRWILLSALGSAGLVALIMYVPVLQPVFRLQPVGLAEWGLALLVSSSVVWLLEGWKYLIRRGVIPERWI